MTPQTRCQPGNISRSKGYVAAIAPIHAASAASGQGGRCWNPSNRCPKKMSAGRSHRVAAAPVRAGQSSRARSVQCAAFADRNGRRARKLNSQVMIAATAPSQKRSNVCNIYAFGSIVRNSARVPGLSCALSARIRQVLLSASRQYHRSAGFESVNTFKIHRSTIRIAERRKLAQSWRYGVLPACAQSCSRPRRALGNHGSGTVIWVSAQTPMSSIARTN